MKKLLLKWKRDWWKNIAEMEAELIKKYCWNESGIDEEMLLKLKRDWWKYIAEMEAGLMKNIAEMEAGLTKNTAEWERNFLIN